MDCQREHAGESAGEDSAGESAGESGSVRTFCQENDRDLAVRRNPVSDCADGVAIRPGGVPARLGGEEFLYMSRVGQHPTDRLKAL